MKFLLTTSVLAFVLIAAPKSDAAPAAPPGWNAGMRAQVLTGAEKDLGTYFFANRNATIRAALNADRSKLLAIGDPRTFADAVTKVLYAASHDKHLGLWYSARPQPTDRKPTRADIAMMHRADAFFDYGYQSSARLPGNIGYMRIGGFADYPGPKATFDRMMALLESTDALIIDMRGNGGGDPRSVNYLLAYFFPHAVEVTGFHWRKGAKITAQRMYTPAKIGGARYLDKPVYVLTGGDTISGGEQFCYDLQALHRATLIGHTTAGGANIGGPVPIDPYFAIFIPVGTAYNPYTRSNWEGAGVKPDVAVGAGKALLDAYTRALKAAKDPFDASSDARARALADPRKALEQALPKT